MPLRRQGRYVETTPDELNAWLGKESGKPVHVATENTDLTAELKRGLSFVRREKEPNAGKERARRSRKAKAHSGNSEINLANSKIQVLAKLAAKRILGNEQTCQCAQERQLRTPMLIS